MTASPWSQLETEIAQNVKRWGSVRFWLRDDDAVTVTPALERLAKLCGEARMPILLAAVPAGARQDLADWLGSRPSILPCQHGWSHANHAEPGARACELGGQRDDGVILEELRLGQHRMAALFGESFRPILVPPWNRIRASLVPRLAGLGYRALSTFRSKESADPAPLPIIDCDLDIINWRAGRTGRSIEDLCQRLCDLMVATRVTGAPIGLLTHHLAHDEAAWTFLEAFFRHVAPLPGVAFVPVPGMGE